MASYTGSKINQILRVWLNGTVAVLPWLEKHGVYQQLVHEYEKTAWLTRVGQGAYAKAGDKVQWTGGLHAIQEQLKLPVHAGAKTALQLQGYAHFLPIGKNETISLFGSPNVKLPAWFRRHRWGVKVRYTTTNLFASQTEQSLTKKDMVSYSISYPHPSAP